MRVITSVVLFATTTSLCAAAGATPLAREAQGGVTKRRAEIRLSARWLLLDQVAIHIRGRITVNGQPLGAQQIRLSASGGDGRRQTVYKARSAADGSFGFHLRVVARARWRQAEVRRQLRERFRFIIASFAGTPDLQPVRIRAAVTGP